MALFRISVQSNSLAAVCSRSAKRRRWGIDAMLDSYEFRDHRFASARWSAPVRRERAAAAGQARLALQQEAAAEIERERVLEREREAAAEREIEDVRWRERAGDCCRHRPGAAALGCQFMAGRDPAADPGQAVAVGAAAVGSISSVPLRGLLMSPASDITGTIADL